MQTFPSISSIRDQNSFYSFLALTALDIVAVRFFDELAV